jgi:hypothetical protein
MPSVSVAVLVASVHFSPGSTLVPRKAPIAGCFVPDAKPFPQSLPPFFSLIRRCSLFRAAKRVRDPAERCKPSKSAIITTGVSRGDAPALRQSPPTGLTGERRAPDIVDQYVRNLKFHCRFLKRKHAARTPEHAGWACRESVDALM